MMGKAPYFETLANAPIGGEATWLTTEDGVSIRVVTWGQSAPKGTVLLFPGRTEYAEKYGPAAADLLQRGYATLTVDWRGQGIAERLLPEPNIGHVDSFHDYQHDVQAILEHARVVGLPEPFYLLGHSMGACIGLRSLHNGLAVDACAFTGPMWGIRMSAPLRPVAWGLSTLSRTFGFSGKLAPGQSAESYVLRHPFEGNVLTNDPEMFAWMNSHLTAQPEMALGGPSLHWLNEALKETRALHEMASPNMPCITFLGADEAIVDVARIHDRMARWPKGELVMVDAAQHELLMEGPSIRNMVFDRLAGLFDPT